MQAFQHHLAPDIHQGPGLPVTTLLFTQGPQPHRSVTQWDLCGAGVSRMEEGKRREVEGNSTGLFWSNLSPSCCNLLKMKVG